MSQTLETLRTTPLSSPSQFIQVATGQEDGVGHGLNRFTNEIIAVRVSFAQHIVLVDTPGFDDHSTFDQQILFKVSEWLQKACASTLC